MTVTMNLRIPLLTLDLCSRILHRDGPILDLAIIGESEGALPAPQFLVKCVDPFFKRRQALDDLLEWWPLAEDHDRHLPIILPKSLDS